MVTKPTLLDGLDPCGGVAHNLAKGDWAQPRWEPARLLVYPNMLLVLAKDQPHRTLICLGPRSCLSRLAQGEGDGVEEEALPLAHRADLEPSQFQALMHSAGLARDSDCDF